MHATEQTEQKTEQKTETRTFYSKHSALTIQINPGKRYFDTTKNTTVTEGQKIVAFTEQADGYGRLTTDDPEVIEKLEKRTDVLNPGEYVRATMPLKEQIRQQDEERKRLERELTEKNELLKTLQEQGELPTKKGK